MKENKLHTLITLDDFKAILSLDDRDDKLSQYCLVTATYTIEQHCLRHLLRKKHFEELAFWGDYAIPLTHYPVKNIIAVYAMGNREWGVGNREIVEPEFYSFIPDSEEEAETQACLILSPSVRPSRGEICLMVIYNAGYPVGKVPPDLAYACLELATWNMNRYKSRKIGTTGNIRGSGKDGEHFELSMPENVKALLEPYRRETI